MIFLLFACPAFDTIEPYYGNGPKPAVTALTPASEVGTVGGQEVTITGSNFGSDPTKLLVQFAAGNAEILSVTDTAITVKVPPGPMTGGAVDIRIATPEGYDIAEGAYLYDVGSTYDSQRAFIQINNFTHANGNFYTGEINGSAEAFNFFSGRYHTPSIGFWGVADMASPVWQIENPAISKFTFGVEDLHEELGTVQLLNAATMGNPSYYCVDPKTGRATSDDPETCQSAQGVSYSTGELNFCSYNDVDGIPTGVYELDWPMTKDFFSVRSSDPSDIFLNLPDLGLNNIALTLPEPVAFEAISGFDDPSNWADVSEPFSSCFDGDIAAEFTWEPSTATYTPVVGRLADGKGPYDGAVVGQQTWVQFAIDLTPIGWLGITTPPLRAVITVPDSYNEDRGTSQLELPADVLALFPTLQSPPGGLGVGSYDPALGYGLLFITALRITDYAIYSEALGGDIVVSYASGEVTYKIWTNPEDGCIQ